MGFKRLVTFARSEPLLTKAACHLLRDSSMKLASHLANHSNLHCIDRGSCGELVAALIIMQAHDAALMSSGTRWVLVGKFMEALLPAKFYNDTLVQSLPREWHTGECLSFDDTFRDYAMWFNHVIRIKDIGTVNMTRTVNLKTMNKPYIIFKSIHHPYMGISLV
jgi:hypothetical protein